MSDRVINLRQKLALIDDTWSPRIVAKLNNYLFKVVKLEGEFVWHKHDDTDEAFIVVSGNLEIDLPDRTIQLSEGEMFVVPRGIEHRPRASSLCQVLLVEPSGTPNTGDVGGERTVEEDVWI